MTTFVTPFAYFTVLRTPRKKRGAFFYAKGALHQSLYQNDQDEQGQDELQVELERFASGQADMAFDKVAQLLAGEIDEATGRLIARLEPMLVALLSLMIGAILLAVMMPLAGVLSAMA